MSCLIASFGPPLMTIEVENNIALVTVKGPMRYQPSHQMPVVSMATIYRQMMYNLSINNTYRKKTVSIKVWPSFHVCLIDRLSELIDLMCVFVCVSLEPFHTFVWSVQAPPDGVQHRVLLLCSGQVPCHACPVSVIRMAVHNHTSR